jgi:ribosomal protein L37AE/L43A
MVDESDNAIVICPTCRHTTERHLGWFKTVRVWDCPFCGAALEMDYDQLEKSLTDKNSAGAECVARLSPRPNRGITTRRTR